MNYLEKTKKLYRILSYILISLMFIGILGREILLFLSFPIMNKHGLIDEVSGIIYIVNLLIIMIPTIIFIYLEAKNKKLILDKIIPRTKNKIANAFLYIIFVTMYISLIIIFEIIISLILIGIYALIPNFFNYLLELFESILKLFNTKLNSNSIYILMLLNPFPTTGIFMACYGLAIYALFILQNTTTIINYLIVCSLFYFLIVFILVINMAFGYKIYRKQNEEKIPKTNLYRIFFHVTSIAYFFISLIAMVVDLLWLNMSIFDTSINCMLYVFILEVVAIVIDLVFMIKNKKRKKLDLE